MSRYAINPDRFMCRKVIGAMQGKDRWMTARDVQAELNWSSYDSVRSALHDLEKTGAMIASGESPRIYKLREAAE